MLGSLWDADCMTRRRLLLSIQVVVLFYKVFDMRSVAEFRYSYAPLFVLPSSRYEFPSQRLIGVPVYVLVINHSNSDTRIMLDTGMCAVHVKRRNVRYTHHKRVVVTPACVARASGGVDT